jgi:hypothetical protein
MKQVSDPFSFPSSVTVNTQCDLDEHWFIGVALIWRMKFPIISRSIPSYSFAQWCTDIFLRWMFY